MTMPFPAQAVDYNSFEDPVCPVCQSNPCVCLDEAVDKFELATGAKVSKIYLGTDLQAFVGPWGMEAAKLRDLPVAAYIEALESLRVVVADVMERGMFDDLEMSKHPNGTETLPTWSREVDNAA